MLREEIPFGSWSLFAAILVVCVFGLADDVRHFGARAKFFGQLIAALIVVSGTSVHVMQLGDLFGFGTLFLDKWSYLVTVVALIGLMNAVNMVDGIDGLAGSLVILPLTMFAILATTSGNSLLALEIWILVGAIAGFLSFNLRLPWRPRAYVFMGDVGSLMLGLLLGWYAIKMAGIDHAPLRPITAVWIVALPLLDMGSVMLLRVLAGKSPFHADRGHTHHVLLDAGYSVTRVVTLLSAISILFGLIGLYGELYDVPEYVMFYAFIVVLGCFVWALSRPATLIAALRLDRD